MAKFLAKNMKQENDIFCGKYYDLVIIPTPAIEADWLEQKYNYDGFVFLSKHAAASNVLALTCHSTGNFSDAKFGGNSRQIAVPHPYLQKRYLQALQNNAKEFPEFQITVEATHHGPTALSKPSIFVEIGTTPAQWNDVSLCEKVAQILHEALIDNIPQAPVALCFGSTHYPKKFTNELLYGKYALGTITPKRALEGMDQELFSHIISKNHIASAALLDWKGLDPQKQKILKFLESTSLEIIKL